MVGRALSEKAQKALEAKGFAPVHLHRESDLFSFCKALEYAVDHNIQGPYVSKHTAEELLDSGAEK